MMSHAGSLPHQCVRVLETVGLPLECRSLPTRVSVKDVCHHPSRAILPPTPPVNVVPSALVLVAKTLFTKTENFEAKGAYERAE